MKVIGHVYDDTATPPVRTILDDGSPDGLVVDGDYSDGEDITP